MPLLAPAMATTLFFVPDIASSFNVTGPKETICSGDPTLNAWPFVKSVRSFTPLRMEGSGPPPETLQDQEKKDDRGGLTKSRGKVEGPRGAVATLGIPLDAGIEDQAAWY
jgi:hypothetical protein